MGGPFCLPEEDDNLRYDSVSCVFGVDDHPHIPDATAMARDKGIELAVSNQCFELWTSWETIALHPLRC